MEVIPALTLAPALHRLYPLYANEAGNQRRGHREFVSDRLTNLGNISRKMKWPLTGAAN